MSALYLVNVPFNAHLIIVSITTIIYSDPYNKYINMPFEDTEVNFNALANKLKKPVSRPAQTFCDDPKRGYNFKFGQVFKLNSCRND